VRRLLAVVAAFALLAGTSLVAVERCGDRELFVPPPDAVAEGFVREVVAGRYAQARTYLANPESMSDADVRQFENAIESWIGGEPSEVDAEVVSHDDTQALTTVHLSSARGSQALSFTLEFDKEWKIASR
jgi:hypothetical protein